MSKGANYMKLDITNLAAEWYEEEYDITKDTELRLFVRYGGVGGLIPGFSLGVNIEESDEIYAEKTIENLTIYIEEKDAWYFDDKNLLIEFNHDLSEPEFTYD